MTALAGFISKRPAPHGEEVVTAMLNRISRQDSVTESIRSGPVVLGALRSRNASSCLAQCPEAVAVCRGDVLNHHQLREMSKEHRFLTDTQAESIMAAFIAQGTDSLCSHNGPCILACRQQHQNATHIVRDRYGELSLYYTQGADYVAFATEIKALLELVPPRWNRDALSYKAFEFCVGAETLFKDIASLKPGEILRVDDDGQCRVTSWWHIWEHLVEIPSSTPEHAIGHVLELLEDAVHLRQREDGACLLSGGIDSSLIACMVKPNLLYHAHYDFVDFDELEYAQCVADHLGQELRIITPQKDDYLNQGEAILHTLDTPCTWTSFTLWMLLKRMSADGVEIVFTGEGADELFGGYHRYHLLYHDEQIRQLDAMQQYTYLIDKYYGSRVDRYAKLINRYENCHDTHVHAYLTQLLSHFEHISQGDIVNFMTLVDFHTTAQVLFHMSDRICSRFNILPRSPFMDYRMVQLAFSLGTQFKINEGVTKWILRKVAAHYLPPRILARMDKRGFSAPVNRWFHWDSRGKYSRHAYKDSVFTQWRRIFAVED